MIGIIPYGTNEPIPRRTFPYVTAALVAINIGVFAYELLLMGGRGSAALNDFITQYGIIPQQFSGHSLLDYRLITSIFLHGGFLHLISNLLFLMAFGDNVEDGLGHLRYAVLYLVWGVIGGLTHIFFNAGSLVPTIGASGAIAGVLGAYLVMFPRGSVRVFFLFFIFFTFTRLPAIFLIGSWFIMQLFNGIGALDPQTAPTGGVAVWAHVGGFIAGVVTALLLKPQLGPAPNGPAPNGSWD
jgi:membrane associated rhomboid family serine protease